MPAQRAVSRPHVPIRSGTSLAHARIRELGAGSEREPLAVDSGRVPGEQRSHDLDRLAKRRQGTLLLQPEPIEPRALRETEVRASARDRVEHRDLTCDLVRMQREGVQRDRAETDPLRHACHQQKRADRRLVEEIVEDRDHVDARVLRAPSDRLVRRGLLVGPKPDAELARYVSSSVTSVRSPIRSMRMTRRSSGSGQATSESCSSQSSSGEPPHLRGQEREHGLHREEAEVLAVGNAHAARLRDLEGVADLEPAHRAPFDPLDGHAQVVEPHLGHLRGP